MPPVRPPQKLGAGYRCHEFPSVVTLIDVNSQTPVGLLAVSDSPVSGPSPPSATDPRAGVRGPIGAVRSASGAARLGFDRWLSEGSSSSTGY
jgi:hypothetical protein